VCVSCCWLQVLGQRTEGFSGSDINTVVKDVLMQPIRLLRDATHFRKVRPASWHMMTRAQQQQQQQQQQQRSSSISQLRLSARFLLQSALRSLRSSSAMPHCIGSTQLAVGCPAPPQHIRVCTVLC
jgi:SpoVK/Ycf46/Vps4 family AAA+-type ATPase